MYLTLDQATSRTKRLTDDQDFTISNLKQLAEAGSLSICFKYRGTLGVFDFPVKTLPPIPKQMAYFDGYLRSLARPRLRSDVVIGGRHQVVDQLTPTAVEIASTSFPGHKIDVQPPLYLGRVREGVAAQPAIMESNPIPESAWLIERDDLESCIRNIQRLATGGDQGQGTQKTLTATVVTAHVVPAIVTVSEAGGVTPLPVGDDLKPADPNWKMRIQTEATALVLRLRKAGAQPTKHSILGSMTQWCKDNGVKTDNGIVPSHGYLRTHVLGGKHWDVPG